ncbi:MAG: sugar phosphate isomerase/epimerase [Maritimibacter sp.]
MASISYQLFSSRNHPLEETLAMLAGIGLKEVEGFGAQFEDPAATKALLDQHGMTMPTGHFAFDLVEGDPAKALSIAETLGVKAVVVPFLMPDRRPSDRHGWAEFAELLAEAGKPILDAGLKYGWHNHDFEFTQTADGCLPIEMIADASEDIGLELDLAWITRAGKDPVDWINRYAGRIIAAHVKDLARPGECADEGGWADLGHGIMDWGRIIPALRAAEVSRWVLEHDNPADHQRFATRSFETVSTF